MKKILIIIAVYSLVSCKNSISKKQNPTLKSDRNIELNIIAQQITNKNKLSLIENNSDTLQLKYGKYFGQCTKYCDTELWIISKGIRHTKSSPNFKKGLPKLPSKVKVFDLSLQDYGKLIKLIDLNKIRKLNKRIGCPDCNDTGAEWIDIKTKNIDKRITIENGAKIEGISELLILLRNIQYIK